MILRRKKPLDFRAVDKNILQKALILAFQTKIVLGDSHIQNLEYHAFHNIKS